MTQLAGAGIYKAGGWNQDAIKAFRDIILKYAGDRNGVKKLATYKQGSFAVPQ
jgi:hypothetical protein